MLVIISAVLNLARAGAAFPAVLYFGVNFSSALEQNKAEMAAIRVKMNAFFIAGQDSVSVFLLQAVLKKIVSAGHRVKD